MDRGGLERLELARLADAAADGLPLGVDDLDARDGRGGLAALALGGPLAAGCERQKDRGGREATSD